VENINIRKKRDKVRSLPREKVKFRLFMANSDNAASGGRYHAKDGFYRAMLNSKL
jgi:hypothetical protein